MKYEEILSNIKSEIERKGLKKGVVAKRAGFSPQEFSDILTGRRKLLRVERVPDIAEALGTDIADLFKKTAD